MDTNLLVYAHRREPIHHEASLELIRSVAKGSSFWALPWPCIYEFFSIVTNPRIWKDTASSPNQAWKQVTAWSGSPTISPLAETEEFLDVLERFVLRGRVRGPIVDDARVAALCVAYGIDELLTADRDFALFPEPCTRNPLR